MHGHKKHLQRVGKRITFSHHLKHPLSSLPELPATAVPGSKEHEHSLAEDLHDWVLGGQDGLVNVLGSILGVAIVTSNKSIILVAGLAAVAAECISMAAVAYTSVKASYSYYQSQREEQRRAIEENPVLQREILIDIYERKGLSRADAQRIVTELTKDKQIWLESMMEEHLRMYAPEKTGPLHSAFVVGFSSIIGSFIPIIPFFFMAGVGAIVTSCVTSVIALFILGAASAKLTIGDWRKRGLEMAIIGGTAAAVSFAIGFAFVNGFVSVG
jgi:vacuolar iron transporter family protein